MRDPIEEKEHWIQPYIITDSFNGFQVTAVTPHLCVCDV